MQSLVYLRFGRVDGASLTMVLEGGAPPVGDESAPRMSFDEIPKGQWWVANSAGLFLLPLVPTLVASLLQVVGHKGTDGGLGWFIIVVIIVETFAASSFRWVHDGFAVRPCATLVDATVASLQLVVVGEVFVLFEHFLLDALKHVVEAHPRRDGLKPDPLAARLMLVQEPDCCLLAIPYNGDEEDVMHGLPLEVPGQ